MMKFRLNCKLEGVKYDIVVSRILDCIAYWNRKAIGYSKATVDGSFPTVRGRHRILQASG